MPRAIYCSLGASISAISTSFSFRAGRRVVYYGAVFIPSFLFLAWTMATASARSDVHQAGRAGRSTLPAVGVSGEAQGEQALVLEPGKAVERDLAGGETHTFQIKLTAGQFAQVGVDQRHIDVAVLVLDPVGKKIVDADMYRTGESETFSLVAETTGTYRLEVRASEKNAPRGRYEIKVKDLRVATELDKSAVAAERLMAEGIFLDRQATADTWRQAIEKYKQSSALSKAAKDPVSEATTLYLTSNAYVNLGEKQNALDAGNQALSILQAAPKQSDEEQQRIALSVEANTFEAIGRVHNIYGDKKQAIEFFNRALPLWRAIHDRAGEIITLNSIGMAYHYQGENLKALDLFNQARQLIGEVGDRGKESYILNNLCVIQDDLGEYKKAIDTCNQSLSMRRDLDDHWGQATSYNNLGNIYSNLGEYQKALDFYTQARAIYKKMENRHYEGITLSNIGEAYDALGDYEKAIGSYNEALEIFRDEKDQFREANVLNNMAVCYTNMKDFQKALEINQRVLAIRRAQDNRRDIAITLNNIAAAYSNLGDKQKALEYYDQSISLHRAGGVPIHLSAALRNLGALYRELGRYQKALDCLQESLRLSRAIGHRNGEAISLAHIAGVERDRGNLEEARRRIEESLATIESMRITVMSQRLRATFFASFRKSQEFNVDLLMRLHKQRPSEGFDVAAFEASERGRARSLLELLKEASAEIRQGVDPGLLERERMLRESISEKADNQMRLLSAKHTEEQAAAAAKELEDITTDYEQTRAQIRKSSPRYAALTEPAPLTLKEIQAEALDNDSLLLEYVLGDEKSFLWAVTPTSIKSFELPKRAEIESVAERLYETLTARNRTVANETPEQRSNRLRQADAEFPKISAALSRMLLGPVAHELKSKRLVIVGEGMLQYTSFAVLPAPDARPGAVSSPLIMNHEVISLPSASVLGVLRREIAGRKTADKTVAVFADPVFDRSDPRVGLSGKDRAPATEAIASASDIKRSASESGLQDFVRLRFSRQEADQIARFASDDKKLKAVDFAANRATAISPELARYAIIHFATHGLINNQHPELSGVILSLVDEQGRPQNGFLRLYDIYNMKLEADLVVLSACQTALGKEIKGEGLMGMTRGFMYAGAPRLVTSLWQVDDHATAELMGRFYESMFRQGLRPAAALQAAQVSMWKDKRWHAPHYWAAFTLQGEWK